MQKDRLVSVVVPVYNVEKYLRECVESIVTQTYTNLEIILVDDGSTDGSGSLCDALASEDSRIMTIHKTNGGLSDARNYGIEKATGDFITFIDSDDTVSPILIELMLSTIFQNGVDIVQGIICRSKEDLSEKMGAAPVIFNKDEAIRAFLKRDRLYVSACCKLYRIELVKKYRFPYGLLNEDNFTTYKIIFSADRVAYFDLPLYWHRITTGSIMQSSFSERKLAVLDVPDEITGFLGDDAEKYEKEIKYYAFRQNLSVYNRMLTQCKAGEFNEAKAQLKKKITEYPGKNIYSLKFKVLRFLLKYMHPLYRRIIGYLFSKGKVS